MIINIINYFRSHGIKATVKKIIESLSTRLGIYIKIKSRENLKKSNLGRKLFSKRKIKYMDAGYWEVHPMPSESELEDYYSSIYWTESKKKNVGVNIRDLIHFYILCEVLPSYFSSPKKIMNVGAGHGGISFLFHQMGHEVINIEPSGLKNYYNSKWRTYKNINEVNDNDFDFIYGSHSLEHVQNLHEFLGKIKSKLKKDSYVFWDIPNGNNPKNGPLENRIHIPHTYYFKKDFFNKEFSKIVINECYEYGLVKKKPLYEWRNHLDEDGDCIIVLGSY